MCRKLPRCFGNRLTLAERHSSLITYAEMLNFGERGCCNIFLNLGIQRVSKFQQFG
jgi:hypothetical protein